MNKSMKKGLYYRTHADGSLTCQLCPHHCQLTNGQYGCCRCRRNDTGTLAALNYGQCTAAALDPIEKKPLYRFHPGSRILSLGFCGCNFHCSFCQNWSISQQPASYQLLTPQQAVTLAVQYQSQGNIGLAYTYNEPTVAYEFIWETARLTKQAGLYNVMVTNGYIEEAPLRALLPYIDAWNIDVKAFSDTFYRQLCGGTLAPVLRTVRLTASQSHVEVTTLIIPGYNDSPAAMEKEARWLAAVNPSIALHLTRYFPQYKLTVPMTPKPTLKTLQETAQQYLPHVYIGNI